MTRPTHKGGSKGQRWKAPRDIQRRLEFVYALDRRWLNRTGAWWYVRPSSPVERGDNAFTAQLPAGYRSKQFVLVIDSPSRRWTVRTPLDVPSEALQYSSLIGLTARGFPIVKATTDTEFKALVAAVAGEGE